MPTYEYEALNVSTQKPQKGVIEAASSEEAIARIKAQQLFPTRVQPAKGKAAKGAGAKGAGAKGAGAKGGGGGGAATATKKKRKSGGGGFGGVSAKRLTLFTRQLSTLQDAGLPLLRSLQILEQQQKPGVLKNVLGGVCEEVEGGSALSEAMAKSPRAFNKLYTKMVAAGEVGGVLDVILQRLAEFMEKAERLKSKIKGAMVYPIVVVLIALIILTGIMLLIIPQFKEIFNDFGVELPGLTIWLINTSSWVAGTNAGAPFPGFGAVVVAGSVMLVPVAWWAIRKLGPGRAATDVLMLWTPVFGGLIRKTTIARFTRTLGTLVGAGVPILEAVTITKETCGNWVYERALAKVHDSIREGESFAQPLRESKTCDAIVVNMIDVGEETGEMDAMLLKIADNYDEEVDVAVASLVSLLEPLMVVLLGGMVGTIVIAMFLPMVAMIEGLNKGGV